MSDLEHRYSTALELYRTSGLSIKEICEQTDTPLSAFKAFLWRCHRDLMFARHGISLTPEEAEKTRLRKSKGQSPAAHSKYRDAILACDDMAHIDLNISEIARLFNLDPTGLGQQLRTHFPEIMQRREKVRIRLGISNNVHKGARKVSAEQYAAAVEHLRNSDDTIRQTAEIFKISPTGFRQHLLLYHKDLLDSRSSKRKNAMGNKTYGALTGNGKVYAASPVQRERYKEAVNLYETTSLTQKEIAAKTGITVGGFRNYIRTWRKDLLNARQRRVASDPKD